MADCPYELDVLGWLQFERLCSLLLADAVGVSEPSWMGRADRRRIAIVDGPLSVPGYARPLTGSVGIVVAWAGPDEHGWDRARTFVESVTRPVEGFSFGGSVLVLTNLPAQTARKALELAEFTKGRRLITLGSGEIAALLDERPALRWAMPSVLGLRDLSALSDDDVAAASVFDPEVAASLARVFWPTAAYERARGVIARHRFVVLTGPPEMGKTAIARMLGLALLTSGWGVRECTRPEQVLTAFDRGRRQLFIADDAFGSTEYRPDAGERWAQAMARLLPMLDDHHWLVWTSRPAPLKAGLRRLQRERGAERFPSPGEVTVDASDLSLEEKTLILYRHAKASDARHGIRSAILSAGIEIVEHPHFTPERIRRLVALLAGDGTIQLGGATTATPTLDRLIAEPTEAMRASYRALGGEHRELLMSLLDAPAGWIDERELTATVRRHRPGGLSRPPAELIDRLSDHFLRVGRLGIGWVHPSWRDLVIDELGDDGQARTRFLRACGIDGALLALSEYGGRVGERRLPLLVDDRDWDTLGDRLPELVRELEEPQLTRLLHGLSSLLDAPLYIPSEREEAKHLAASVLRRSARMLEAEPRPLTVTLIDAWYALRTTLRRGEEGEPDPISLSVAPTWIELCPGTAAVALADLARLDDWLAIALILREHDLAQYERLRIDDERPLVANIAPGVVRMRTATNDPLISSVLERSGELFPSLTEVVRAMAIVHRHAQRHEDRDWWVPSDIVAPPSDELAAESGAFQREDVRRALTDL